MNLKRIIYFIYTSSTITMLVMGKLTISKGPFSIWLVVSTPLKKYGLVSWAYYSQYMENIKVMFQSPPTGKSLCE